MGIVSWLHILLKSEIFRSEEYAGFVFRSLSGWLVGAQGLYVWFGLILFLLAAMLLIFVNNRLHMIDRYSYLPALCYVLIVGGVPEMHLFNPALIAVIFLASAFIFIANSFESERLSYGFFTASAIISFATFFYQYMYIYMLAVWLVIALLRPGYWREWVFSILGFAFPLFFAFSWFFLVDDDYARLGDFFTEISTMQRIVPSLSVSTIIFFSICFLLTVISYVYILHYVGSKKVIFRI